MSGAWRTPCRRAGGAVELARNSQIGPYVYPKVPAEFTNWRDEQVGWRETSALFDQSHHMTDLSVEGPDAVRLLSDLGVNTFKNFALGKAKQFVACNPDGYVIGDAILFFLGGEPRLARRAAVGPQLGAVPRRDGRLRRRASSGTSARPSTRRAAGSSTASRCRDRPRSTCSRRRTAARCRRSSSSTWASSRSPATRCARCITGCRARPGWSSSARGRRARTSGRPRRGGRDFGLRQVGSRVYATNTLESGWIPCPLPAVFTGDELASYREWLPANGYEATGSLGGSFYSDDIADYYLDSVGSRLRPFVKFDHDFVGREALEAMRSPPRRKVTLAWNGEDVARAMGTLFAKGDAAKYIDLPLSNYSTWPNDKVLRRTASMVGVSTFSGYSYNERSLLSLAIVDADVEFGTEVTLVWGEEDGGSAKPVVERHVQVEIRAIVSPCPYSEVARTTYAEGWRTRAVAG